MPKKSKFINKADSQRYFLLHRSQTDGAHAEEGVPSEFVLVAADNHVGRKAGDARAEANVSEYFTTRKDHINYLGFKNDGYNYEQHLKPLGGGRFIDKDGKQGSAPAYTTKEFQLNLPSDALPSETEVTRDLEAITIDHGLMDDDLRAALFEDGDDDGAFETLDDDFCIQAMQEPIEKDFDFDAHIASLIARSEANTKGVHAARGWDKQPPIASKKSTKARVKFDDDDEEDMEEVSDYDVEGNDENDGLSGLESEGALVPLSKEEMQKVESQFENTLEDYDDDLIGALEELDELDIADECAIEGDDDQLTQVLDEFLQDQKDAIYADGSQVVKGLRRTIHPDRLLSNSASASATASVDDVEKTVDPKQENAEQLELQSEALQTLKDLDVEGTQHVAIETCQEYLRECREEIEFDCESVLSTYSITDNHPALIKSSNEKFRPYKSRFEKNRDRQDAVSSGASIHSSNHSLSGGGGVSITSWNRESGSIKNGSTARATGSAETSNVTSTHKVAPSRILLTGRLNLPSEYVVGSGNRTMKTIQSKGSDSTLLQRPHFKYSTSHDAKAIDSLPSALTSEDNQAPTGTTNLTEDIDSAKDETGSVSDDVVDTKRKESAEEKKIRKQLAKEQKRAKRESKKAVKNAFKSESSRISSTISQKQSIDNVSVFKY